MSKATDKGTVVFSNLTEAKGYKGAEENKKYTIGVKFEGKAKEAMKKIFARAKDQDDGSVVVYFNRKESMGRPEVKTVKGDTIDKNILDKGTEVQVAYTLKEYDVRGAPGVKGVSYVLDKVKVSVDTVEVDTDEAPF